MARALGVLAGLAVGFAIVALLFKKKVIDMTFDERQELARGKAYQYGFFTLMGCLFFYGLTDTFLGTWCDTLTGCTLCICVALTVFAVTCIRKDAYLSLKEKPAAVMTLFAIIAVVNLALGGVYIASGDLVQNGILTFRAVNPIIGSMAFLILLVYLVNYVLERGEGAE
ncbi:MAG: hypothetical protein E7429_05725 [Ruminococcaceae bacterium]|nr:hypothetical protein [Oscillospiraceae bacterium]